MIETVVKQYRFSTLDTGYRNILVVSCPEGSGGLRGLEGPGGPGGLEGLGGSGGSGGPEDMSVPGSLGSRA